MPSPAEPPQEWPLPNVWLGISAEDQPAADERIPLLLQCPAAVRFVSCEPLLGPISLGMLGTRENWRPVYDGIRWVIAGGESGPKARPMHPDWVRSLRDQCQEAGVPFFFKQWGEWLPHVDTVREELPTKDQFTRVGKKAAGRLIDGREWNECPE